MEYKIDLQLFAEGEKTEEPSAKKRRDAREEGQILQSKEINTVVILFSCFLGLKFFGTFMTEELSKLMINLFNQISDVESYLHPSNMIYNGMNLLLVFTIIVGPILLIAFLSSLVVNYLQVGFLFTTKTLKIKLDRLNPIEGFKKMFSAKALVELAKSVLKITLVGYIAINHGLSQMTKIVKYSNMQPLAFFVNFSDLIFGFVLRILGVLLLLSFMDYFFQWREHEKNLKMSKQELKEEYKQTEGDPIVKGKIKEKQRQMAMSRMMQEIPSADVIITNPTHYAVAIKYEKDKYDAPYLVAKGVDLIAENIKKVAKDNKVPIVENRSLARGIYSSVDIDDPIPEELYEAVAEVLAYVYSLKNES